jgi:hypothetical protein
MFWIITRHHQAQAKSIWEKALKNNILSIKMTVISILLFKLVFIVISLHLMMASE